MKTPIRLPSAGAGFTLFEAIMAMVITGILAAIVAVFVARPVQGYVDTVRRAELTDAADVALRRLARDVRLALPNSLRQTAGGIEFILTKSGGRYRISGDGSNCAAARCLSFTDAASKTFDILGTDPANPPAIAANDFIVIYNLGAGFAPADAYAGGNRTTVGVTAGTPYYATMATNVFAAQSPPLASPNARFQVVDQGDMVVRYLCNGDGTLTRQWGCSFANTSSCANSAVLAGSAAGEPKAACSIDYSSAGTGRSGLLYLRLTLTDTPSGESVGLAMQIHVDNSP